MIGLSAEKFHGSFREQMQLVIRNNATVLFVVKSNGMIGLNEVLMRYAAILLAGNKKYKPRCLKICNGVNI